MINMLHITGYMSAWTAINMDHVRDGETMLEVGRIPGEGTSHYLEYTICKSMWWDYVIEVGKEMFSKLSLT